MMSTSVQEKHRVLWVLWDSSPHSVFLLWINNLHSNRGAGLWLLSLFFCSLVISVFPFLAFCQRIFLLCKEMQTFPKDFDHYVEYTKKRMWKIILTLFFLVVNFYKEALSNVGTQKFDWIMKKTCDHSEFWCQEPISRKVGLQKLCNGQTKSKTDKNNM